MEDIKIGSLVEVRDTYGRFLQDKKHLGEVVGSKYHPILDEDVYFIKDPSSGLVLRNSYTAKEIRQISRCSV